MKITAMALPLLVLLLPACGETHASAAGAGVYEIDKAELKQMMLASMSGAAGIEAVRQQVDEQVAKMSGKLELRADGAASLSLDVGQTVAVDGTWQLDGDQLSLTMKRPDGESDTQTATLADGRITLQQNMGPQTMKLVFVRVFEVSATEKLQFCPARSTCPGRDTELGRCQNRTS